MQDPFLEGLKHTNLQTHESQQLCLARFTALRDLDLNLVGPLAATALPGSLQQLTLGVNIFFQWCGACTCPAAGAYSFQCIHRLS